MYENNFSTADDTTLYLDVDGFEYHRKRMLASVENLVLDTSHSFAMEDEVNGTESVQMLIDHWHKVAETTENFRRFYIDYVDPALVRVKDSIINEDAEVANQLNTEAEIDINNVVHKGLENIRNGFKKATMALVDLFDSDMDENVRAILNKDAYLWTKQEAYLVSMCYEKAVRMHNIETLNEFYNSLLVVNNTDTYDIGDYGRKVYYSNAHLDKDKACVILANLEAMNGVNTEAYQTLLELTVGGFSYAEKSKLELTSKIKVSQNEQGFVINWETLMDGKHKNLYTTMLFFDDGLSLDQKYMRIDDIEGVSEYRKRIKVASINNKLEKYERVEECKDFKELSVYKAEKKKLDFLIPEYDESDIYRFINDEKSRDSYYLDNVEFINDFYDRMDKKQIAIYNYLYQKDKVDGTSKAEEYRRLLGPFLRDEYADEKVSNSSNLEKSVWGITIGADNIMTQYRNWAGIGTINIDSYGDQIPTAFEIMDSAIDSSLSGGWHILYDVNKKIGASIPGVAIGALTGGSGTVAEIVGAGSAATIYGGSAYGNAIGYAEQNGYSDSQAKAFATKTGINEGCKTLAFYGLLKGTGAASSAGYLSAGESAAISAAGGFGIEFLDETSVKPDIQESTLGEDVDVDYKRALENAAVAGLITGAAGYVYAKAQGKNVEEQNIYEKAHALDNFYEGKGYTKNIDLVESTQNYSGEEWCRYYRDSFGSENVIWENATPSQEARSWQGVGKYIGVDDYINVNVKKGTILYRGEPNGSEYFTTLDAIEQSGRNATTLFEGLQVERHPIRGYRGEMQGYLFNEDIASAYGLTSANPQFGRGGLPQYFIPNVDDLIEKGILTPVDVIKLNK